MVVIARFVDTARARRMKGWLGRSHIRARLARGDDGRVELAVPRYEQSRALDLLVTIFLGLGIDHLDDEPAWERAVTMENSLTGAAFAMVAFVLGIIAWITVPVLAAFPFTLVFVGAVFTFAVVAALPGGPGKARDYRVPSRRRR